MESRKVLQRQSQAQTRKIVKAQAQTQKRQTQRQAERQTQRQVQRKTLRRMPEPPSGTIVIGIDFHGRVLDKLETTNSKNKFWHNDVYWHSLAPIHGCNVFSYNQKNYFRDISDEYKKLENVTKDNHKDILNIFCGDYSSFKKIIIPFIKNIKFYIEKIRKFSDKENMNDIKIKCTEYINKLIVILKKTDKDPFNIDDTAIVFDEIKNFLDENTIYNMLNNEEKDLYNKAKLKILKAIKNINKMKKYNSSNCSRFLRIKYNKRFSIKPDDSEYEKQIMGIYVLYDSENKHEPMSRIDITDITQPLTLLELIYKLKKNYKTIYIYDGSCNSSENIDRESNIILGSRTTSSKARVRARTLKRLSAAIAMPRGEEEKKPTSQEEADKKRIEEISKKPIAKRKKDEDEYEEDELSEKPDYKK